MAWLPGNDAGAGEGGHVHHGCRVEFLHVGEGIAQHQAAFGVGVEDFDGHARQGGYDIARAGSAAVRHVFRRGNHGHHVNLGLGFGQDFHGAEDTGGAAHVVLHLVHAFAGLQADAARVEGDAFADKHVGLVLAATVFHHDQARRLLATLADGENGVHAHFFHLLFIKHFGLDAVMVLGQFFGLIGQPGRMADVGRGVAQVTGVVHAAAGSNAQLEGVFECLARAGGLYRHFFEFCGLGFVTLEVGKGVELLFQNRPMTLRRAVRKLLRRHRRRWYR